MSNHNLNNQQKIKIRKKRENKCERCGEPNGPVNIPEERLQLHHRIPICYGGTNEQSNLRLLCKKCHDIEHIEFAKRKNIEMNKLREKLIKNGQYRTICVY